MIKPTSYAAALGMLAASADANGRAEKPARGGESKPARGGESKPARGGESKPARGGESKPARGVSVKVTGDMASLDHASVAAFFSRFGTVKSVPASLWDTERGLFAVEFDSADAATHAVDAGPLEFSKDIKLSLRFKRIGGGGGSAPGRRGGEGSAPGRRGGEGRVRKPAASKA
jgi:hypothetical protein